MNLLDRIADTLYRKQRHAQLDFAHHFATFLATAPQDLADRVAHKFRHKLQASLQSHGHRIKQYLGSNNQLQDQISQPSHYAKQHNSMPKQPQLSPAQLQTQPHHNNNNKHNHLIQIQQQAAPQSISKQRSIDNNSNLPSHDLSRHSRQPKTDQHNNDQSTLHHQSTQAQHPNTHNSKHRHRHFNIKKKDRSTSLQAEEPKQYIQSMPSGPNQNAQLRTLENLEQGSRNRGKTFKEKTGKVRTNLIKLAPLAFEKDKQLREKQANQKLIAAMDFLNTIQSRKNIVLDHPTEWKHDKNQQLAVSKAISSPLNPNFLKLKELTEKYRQQRSGEYEQQDNMQRSEVTRKRYHKGQRLQKFVLEKPQPYNLYNINMSKHELFHYRIAT